MTARIPDHPDPDQIFDLAHGLLDRAASAPVLDHILDCPVCEERFQLAVSARESARIDLPEEHQPATTAPATRRRPLVATAVAAVIALAVLVPRLGFFTPATPLNWMPAEFETAQMRADSAGMPEGLPDALAIFADGKFAAAADDLASLDIAPPWSDLRDVYLAVALVEEERFAAALPLFTKVDPVSLPYRFRVPALWYRSAMWNGLGEPARAREDLELVAGAEGPLGESARDALAAMTAPGQGTP